MSFRKFIVAAAILAITSSSVGIYAEDKVNESGEGTEGKNSEIARENPYLIDIKDLDRFTGSDMKSLIESRIARAKELGSSEDDLKKAERVLANLDINGTKKCSEIIAETVTGISERLSMDPKEFIKTDAGKIVIGVVTYKVVGEDALNIVNKASRIVLSSIWWILTMPIILVSLYHFHGTYKIVTKNEDGKTIADVTVIPRYTWNSSDAKVMSATTHGLALAIVTMLTFFMWVC